MLSLLAAVQTVPAAAAGGADFSPEQLSGLTAWYDAQKITAEDGGRVSEWKNMAGSSYDAVQPDPEKQPVFTKSGKVNGNPGVDFEKDTYLELNGKFDADDISVFAVISADSIDGGSDDNQIFSKLGTSDPWNHNWYFNLKNGGFNFGWKDSETWRDYTGSGNAVSTGKSYLLAGVKAQADGSLYINGEKIGTLSGNAASPNAVHNDSPIYIGGANGGRSMDGTISEIIVYNRGLTEEETKSVNDYLALKWGITPDGSISDGMIYIAGEPISEFRKTDYSYKRSLRKGSDYPEVTAQFGDAEVEIKQADENSPQAVVKVSAGGSEIKYTVEFSIMDKDVLKLKKPEVEQVDITGGFWKEKLDQFAKTTVDYVFDNFERTGTLKNFENSSVAGAKPQGATDPWNDGLLYETIRGASDFLRKNPDEELERRIDGYIDIIYDAALSNEDGYLSTWAMMEKPGQYFDATGDARWYHDAYNFGCMCEAAVHYYKATGKVKLLYVATRFAEFITDNYGYGYKENGEKKINMVPSHEGPEEMLLKLYLLYKGDSEAKAAVESYNEQKPLEINEDDYASLVKFWIENRGNSENRVNNASYGVYAQDHAVYYDQKCGAGHAVRANLFYTGMAAAGIEFDNYTYLDTADKIWNYIKDKQMYITGGVGAAAQDEAYSDAYDLPNDGYCETCAQVAMGFCSEYLSLAFGDSEYADMVEKYIYNGVLGCVGEDGKTFYYQQPLSNAEWSRWSWLEHTPCCPPMFLKFYSEMPSYIYSYSDGAVYVNQYISSDVDFLDGRKISQVSGMPNEGSARISVSGDTKLYLRIPEWCSDFSLKLNSSAAEFETENGYAVINVSDGDIVDISIPMQVKRNYSDERVVYNKGRVALSYGPLVYTFERADNRTVPNFSSGDGNFALPEDGAITVESSDILGGINLLRAQGEYIDYDGTVKSCELTAIPFYARSNRGEDDSFVWVSETPQDNGRIKPYLSKATTSSDTAQSPAAAFDGKSGTYWTAGSVTAPQTIMTDLGAVTDIGSVKVTLLKEYAGLEYELLVSSDAQTWLKAAAAQTSGEFEVDYPARYAAVKFTKLPAGEFVSVREIAVYKKNSRVNQAAGSLCGATSAYELGQSAFAMTDGCDTTRYCPAGEAKPQTVTIDLGFKTEIEQIDILFEKPSDWTYNIKISDDGKNYSTYISETYKVTEDGQRRLIDKKADARYIQLNITATTGGVWASVWEFDIKTGADKNIFDGVVSSGEIPRQQDPEPVPGPDPVPDPVPAFSGALNKNGKTYYYKNGVLVKNSWITTAKGIVRTGVDGAVLKNRIIDKKYAVDKNGYKVTSSGIKTIGKYKYLFKKGVIRKNCWYVNRGRKYRFTANGRMAKGMFKVGPYKYYASKNGAAARRKVVTVKKRRYYFDKKGRMVKNKSVIYKNRRYFAGKKGVLRKNCRIVYKKKVYKLNSKGIAKLIKKAS